MATKTPLVFFGSSKLVLPIIEVLQKNFDVKLVITTEQKQTDAVPAFCTTNNIPYVAVISLSDDAIKTQLQKTNVEVAVLADFGLIIPDEILYLFPKGIINIHPSLLPKFRGPTPVQSAMLSNDTQTGVTIIRLDEQVDHGPMLAQEAEPILNSDTGETLHVRLFKKGAQLLATVLPEYLSATLSLQEQDHTKATFTQKLTRDSGYISPEELKINKNATHLTKMIQAYYPWPGVWTTIELRGEQKRVKLLPNMMLQVQDKKPMSYKDFLNGYPEMKEWITRLKKEA